ncbi:AlkA N-terminal domain-containing protein [Homoserinibacter sp. YIM 151385]|uniref:AlkA N-terminal domain-containing protein n=1 Tax=Homoserinibacter sp. YIM 151385 TaxID=2985506 RepID=UPI0022F0AF1F|nr:AlkA N-terminal domain-containing protein [Homoserinibacter sp. YIM 151385]WBU38191.1 hypothetical protein OF852_01000 [Homoserinibacter sp. YIM 151385]
MPFLPAVRRRVLRPEPADLEGVLRFLRARAIPGVEDAGERHYARSLRARHGLAVARLELDAERTAIGLELHLEDARDEAEVARRMLGLLDLDAPAAEIDAALGAHPLLAPRVRATPGIRIPGAVDGPEIAARAIVGQQISVVAALGHLTELAVAGDALPEPVGGIDRLFPTPAQLAEGGAELLRGPAARRATLRATSAALAEGAIVLDRDAGDRDAEEIRAQLLALRGIGPWTADYIGLRALGRRDVMMSGDVALRLGLRRLGVEDATLLEFAEPFRPWRSHLALHLWAAAAPPNG